MRRFKRVFLIVADSMGVGEAPDSHLYFNGDTTDVGADTFGALCSLPDFSVPFLSSLGIGCIDGVAPSYPKCDKPIGVFGKMRELSAGKDTVTGHWEIGGLVSTKPMPTFPNGFPEAFLSELSRKWGRGYLCNKPYSGTAVIKDYGEEHIKTGKLIVYTSADSVFQIAAHEELVPPAELYKYCITAREMLSGEYGVGRVIARPFKGGYPSFERTSNRRDYALEPFAETLCDRLTKRGYDVIGVGKIGDIFAHRGITEEIHTADNNDGMAKTAELLNRGFRGLCFVNLVDFDMKYGHRRDTLGYARAVEDFDAFLSEFSRKMGEDDLLIVTADHGCDPSHEGTDHTREYVPVLMYAKGIDAKNIGTVDGFSFISKTVEDCL